MSPHEFDLRFAYWKSTTLVVRVHCFFFLERKFSKCNLLIFAGWLVLSSTAAFGFETNDISCPLTSDLVNRVFSFVGSALREAKPVSQWHENKQKVQRNWGLSGLSVFLVSEFSVQDKWISDWLKPKLGLSTYVTYILPMKTNDHHQSIHWRKWCSSISGLTIRDVSEAETIGGENAYN